MSQWFRMYAEVLDDPKVQRLAPADFKGWVNILCLTARNDGELPSVEDIGFALRMDPKKCQALVKSLVSAGLLVECETGLKPNQWDARQYKSDVSTERVKRFRQRSKKHDETKLETAPDTDTDTDVPLAKANGAKPDSDQEFWEAAKAYLGASKASLIGKWVKDHGKTRTAEAITAAQLDRAVNPIEFIQGHFRAHRKTADMVPIC